MRHFTKLRNLTRPIISRVFQKESISYLFDQNLVQIYMLLLKVSLQNCYLAWSGGKVQSLLCGGGGGCWQRTSGYQGYQQGRTYPDYSTSSYRTLCKVVSSLLTPIVTIAWCRTPPQCVNCYVLVSPSSSLVCPKCSLLVCSAQCSTGSDHQVECSILSNIRTKLRKKNRDGDKIWRDCLPSITASVTTIRLLSLKWR